MMMIVMSTMTMLGDDCKHFYDFYENYNDLDDQDDQDDYQDDYYEKYNDLDDCKSTFIVVHD